jgi:hypothetical protein
LLTTLLFCLLLRLSLWPPRTTLTIARCSADPTFPGLGGRRVGPGISFSSACSFHLLRLLSLLALWTDLHYRFIWSFGSPMHQVSVSYSSFPFFHCRFSALFLLGFRDHAKLPFSLRASIILLGPMPELEITTCNFSLSLLTPWFFLSGTDTLALRRFPPKPLSNDTFRPWWVVGSGLGTFLVPREGVSDPTFLPSLNCWCGWLLIASLIHITHGGDDALGLTACGCTM